MKLGIFDSGIGGLSVANSIIQRNPYVPLVYLADSAYLPYGTQDPQVIASRVKKILKFLVDQGCTHILCACNTAYAISQEMTKSKRLPILAVTDFFLEQISPRLPEQNILLIATQNTIESSIYPDLIEQFKPGSTHDSYIDKEMVMMIESRVEPKLLSEHLFKLRSKSNWEPKAVILGCTHYNWITDIFESVFPKAEIFSSAQTFDFLISEPSQSNTVSDLAFFNTNPGVDLVSWLNCFNGSLNGLNYSTQFLSL